MLDRLRSLAALAVKQKQIVADLEQQLQFEKDKLTTLQRETIPELLKEAGLDNLETDGGVKISVRSDVSARIPPENRGEAFEWLESHGYGDIIKYNVSAAIPREVSRQKILEAAQHFADETEIVMDFEEKVHPQTLKSFIKERIAAGECPPLDLFGATAFEWADIKIGDK